MWATALSHKLVIHHMSAVLLPPAPSYCAKCWCSIQTQLFSSTAVWITLGFCPGKAFPSSHLLSFKYCHSSQGLVESVRSRNEALSRTATDTRHRETYWGSLVFALTPKKHFFMHQIGEDWHWQQNWGGEGWDRELHSYEGIPISPDSHFQYRMSTG